MSLVSELFTVNNVWSFFILIAGMAVDISCSTQKGDK